MAIGYTAILAEKQAMLALIGYSGLMDAGCLSRPDVTRTVHRASCPVIYL